MQIIITNSGVLIQSNWPVDSLNPDQTIYEVIRVIDGISLFLEDHFSRLQKSMAIQGISFEMGYQEFRQKIAELVRQNRKPEGNIKFEYSVTKNEIQWVFSFIPHSYPTLDDYRNGVKTALLDAERENPNAKVVQNKIREKANRMIAEQQLFEVLLVDRSGLITEGSRSNVFFVKGEVFYTAPVSSVLAGVTRQKVMECLNELSFPVIEEGIRADEISRFDAVFLTGTSPKIMPVKSIGDLEFDTQLLSVKKLMDNYNQKIAQYIQDEIGSKKKGNTPC